MSLPHVGLAGVDSYRVVHDVVEDDVCGGAVAETAMPFLGRQLGGERGVCVVILSNKLVCWRAFCWILWQYPKRLHRLIGLQDTGSGGG